MDILDSTALSGFFSGDKDPRTSRELYVRVGRQLNFLLGRMDRSLRPVESGRLIRTVLRLEEASVFHYYVRPGEYLTGVSLGRDAAEAGDRAMTRLATQFRNQLRQLRIDYGGFIDIEAVEEAQGAELGAGESAHAKEPTHAEEQAHAEERAEGISPAFAIPGPASHKEALHTEEVGDPGPSTEQIRVLCASSLFAEDLHYVAYVDPASEFLSADLLEDDSLTAYFASITRQERRDRYQELARRLHFVVARLDHSLKAVLPGRLTRTVLDVDEGALYYCAVGNGAFLLGVTLHQDRVAYADRRMTVLTHSVQRIVKENGENIN
ncbi:hypothetical protein ACFYWY_34120 [Streptomyces sp. NPDC002870]|uniref:hypothetical protein n=1 Tax=Streptomyces sp. NPDC002870 TaxID=3364666 RepID=UPI0036B43C1C